MGRFAAVFIGVLLVGEDGGENARTIAFRDGKRRTRAKPIPEARRDTMLHTTAILRLRAADTNRSRNLAAGNNWHRAQAAVNLGV